MTLQAYESVVILFSVLEVAFYQNFIAKVPTLKMSSDVYIASTNERFGQESSCKVVAALAKCSKMGVVAYFFRALDW